MSPLVLIRQAAAAALLLFLVARAGGADSPASAGALQEGKSPVQPVILAAKGTAQIARSAQLIIDGTAADDSLQLRIRRASDGSVLSGEGVTVTVDGKNEVVAHGTGGNYEVPINDLLGDGSSDSAKDVDIVVPHDGIREILSNKVAVARTASAGGLLGDHKQIAWWILNIVIVLVAASVISRRKSPS